MVIHRSVATIAWRNYTISTIFPKGRALLNGLVSNFNCSLNWRFEWMIWANQSAGLAYDYQTKEISRTCYGRGVPSDKMHIIDKRE